MTRNNVDKYRKVYPELNSSEKCTGCSICVKACPVEVIELKPWAKGEIL